MHGGSMIIMGFRSGGVGWTMGFENARPAGVELR